MGKPSYRFTEVKDSGKRQEFETGSVRDTAEGKGRYDLLPPYAIHRLAQHFENGAKVYGDRNWEKGQPLCRYIGSALRHLFRYLGGSREEDHLAAVAWNALAFIETEYRINEGQLPKELDDMPKEENWSTLKRAVFLEDPPPWCETAVKAVEICPECGGTGENPAGNDFCHKCNGAKVIPII